MKVSVVIPNYNGRDLLEKHLPEIITTSVGAEIIMVDDASTDDSVAFVQRHYPSISVVTHSVNRRFAVACNTGVKSASGDVVVLLNSDVSPIKGYLDPLVGHFSSNKNLFAVGCGEVNSNNASTIESGKGCGGFRRGLLVHWPCADQSKGASLWVSGGSGAFSKQKWTELEGMDELFAPAYEEDRDICYRALKMGYEVIFEPQSVVLHVHESTNTEALGSTTMQIASYKNQLILVWKNVTSVELLIQHVLWMPYHVLTTTIRSRGLFLLGLLWAFAQLPRVLIRRFSTIRKFTVSDENVLQSISN